MSGWCHNQGGKRYGLRLQVQPQRRAFGTAGSPSQMPVAVVGWLQVMTCSHKKGCIPKNPNMGHTWKLAILVWNYDKSCFFPPFSGKTNLRNFLIRLADTALSTSHSRSSQTHLGVSRHRSPNNPMDDHRFSQGKPCECPPPLPLCWNARMAGVSIRDQKKCVGHVLFSKSPERFWSLG